MNHRIWSRVLALAPALLLAPAPAAGQCEPELVETFMPDDHNHFGWAVAVDGGLVVIGASSDGQYSGAVYVYRFDGAEWALEQKLTVPGDDRFLGSAVAVSGDLIAAGAPGENGYEGAVYVFQHQQGEWNQVAHLVPPGLGEHSAFGESVAMEVGERGPVVAGAAPDFPLGSGFGAVHVYGYDGLAWQYEGKLTPADQEEDDGFGRAVALDHDRLVIGAHKHDNHRGAAYVFAHSGDAWTEEAMLVANDGFVGQYFGVDVGVDTDTAIVGSYAYNYGCDCPLPGSAYVFREGAGVWTQEAKLLPSDGMEEYFGVRVALDGNVAVVGSDVYVAAYVYARGPGGWEERAKLPLPGVDLMRDLDMSGLQAVFGGSSIGSRPCPSTSSAMPAATPTWTATASWTSLTFWPS